MNAEYRHFAECASTNDIARDWARAADDPAPEGAVVTADFQTAGRGRRGRSWLSIPGDNLLMSVVLRPPYPVSDAWQLAFVAALAVSDALADFHISAYLKWPNDIIVDARKVGGVLIETTVDPSGAWAAIVGIGVNVNQTAFDNESTYEVPPVSLRMVAGDELAVDDVVRAVHRSLLAREQEHRSTGFTGIVAAWRERIAMGFEIKRGAARGLQRDLGVDGRVLVEFPDGTFEQWGTVDA